MKLHIAATLLLLIATVTTISAETYAPTRDTLELSERQEKSLHRQQRRDSIRANKKVWTSILGGPSYTPEASAGVAGAVLISFKTNEKDTISQRSFFPMGVNFSINGTLVVAGAGTLFFNENRFRIYSTYNFRNEPANFYGVGMSEIESNYRSDTTTLYQKQCVNLYNRFVWNVRDNIFVGPLMDINYSKSTDMNEVMLANSYIQSYRTTYTNIGIGGVVQYDSRDNIATPTNGMLLSAIARIYGRYLGGTYNYEILDLEYRQFKPLFKRATLAWTARTQLSYGDVPFTELPSFGSPSDLRGFYIGEYRDRSMGYGIVEYRQMFGTVEDLRRGRFLAKLGYVVWAGTGTIGATPADWSEWKYNYGVGLRIQLQPGKNFRLDIGKGQGESDMMVYFNMTEAF
ncbi:MAG: BamA/TamA family outer membrane protein [Rikenellaceae bacterium]